METELIHSGTCSYTVTECQICASQSLKPLLFLGYLPPVNAMSPVGQRPVEEPAFPAQVLRCEQCGLVQLGTVVDASVLFPPSYPYTSGTTRILRENFAELYREVCALYGLDKNALCVDIGSNDGTLLSNFHAGGHRVYGIEPTNAGLLALDRGIQTLISFFDADAVQHVLDAEGPATIVTAANCFAHIDDVNGVVENITQLLTDDGIFINESHYWMSLVETLQYDTIYHEHLRHYTLASLKYLLESHGLQIIHAKQIPTHGGSIRVYAARHGRYTPRPSVEALLQKEQSVLSAKSLSELPKRVTRSKLELYRLLAAIKEQGGRVHGIGAPSRASTIIKYVGLDHEIIDCIWEIKGSYKIGKYMPGTLIPVREESGLYVEQPEYALLLSWHIAEELMPKLKGYGFRGDFIIPLPEPRIVRNADIVAA